MSVTGSFHSGMEASDRRLFFFCATGNKKSADIQKCEKERQLDNAESAGPFCCFFWANNKRLWADTTVVFSPKNLFDLLSTDGTALTKFGLDRLRAIGVETCQLETRVLQADDWGRLAISTQTNGAAYFTHVQRTQVNYSLRVS